MAQVQVISGVERRRRWSDDEKRAVVAAAFSPGAVVSVVARRADLHPGQIYRWRQELCGSRGGFAEMIVSPAGPAPTDLSASMIEVVSGDNGQARIPLSAPPELAAAVIRALVQR